MLKKLWPIILVLIISAALRFINLGYSDYQGDEIKAFYRPTTGQTMVEFLMAQRKGPIQFFVTGIEKLILGDFDNNLLIRLPFALANLLSVFFFYKFVELLFNKKTAVYASLFYTVNGFIVAFSRIVQYQSFVLLFMMLALYLFALAVKSEKSGYKLLFVGFISWAICMLSHYDGIFIAPVVFYLLYLWFKKHGFKNTKAVKIFFISGFTSALLVGMFYIPFFLNSSSTTQDYWLGRMTGTISGKQSSSRYLFKVYQPIFVEDTFIGLSVIFASIFGVWYLGKFVKLGFLTKLTTKIYLTNHIFPLLIWFFLAVLFYEKLVFIPGTHIYVYLIPAFIFMALTLVNVENLFFRIIRHKIVNKIIYLPISVFFTFLFLQSYTIFVDNYREYPWEEKKFYIWTLPVPNGSYNLSLFGFPYYRDWEGIRDFIKSLDEPTLVAYSTNERASISRYYIELEKNLDRAGAFVFVKNSQRFINKFEEAKANYWRKINPPVFTINLNGRDISSIYIMPVGTYEDIMYQGY
jgi:4-amino-4-deoxy-L-arabinose transferase-like glycosyltransferase